MLDIYSAHTCIMESKIAGDTLVLIVGGTKYYLKKSSLTRVPNKKLQGYINSGREEIFLDRPNYVFDGIIAYFTSGNLHMPQTVCPEAFKEELDFWEIPYEKMEKCCAHRFLTYFRDKKVLLKFSKAAFRVFERRKITQRRQKDAKKNLGIRRQIWQVLDFHVDTKLSRFYFAVSFTFILASILGIAFSTLPSVRKSREKGSIVVTENATQKFNVTITTDKVPDERGNLKIIGNALRLPDPNKFSPAEPDEKRTVITELPSMKGFEPNAFPDNGSFVDQDTILPELGNFSDLSHNSTPSLTISKNVGLFSTRDFGLKHILQPLFPEKVTKKVATIQKTVDNKLLLFFYIEASTTVFFTAEQVARLLTTPFLATYFLRIANIVEWLLLGASYGRFLLYFLGIEEESEWMSVLIYVQMMRVFRVFHVMKHVTAFKVLCYSVRIGYKDLCMMLLYIVVGIIFFSNLIFFFEETTDFPSIPMSWWWCIVTMTTVGYGDISPQTTAGRIVGGICAISGVIILSLVIPVFVNTFLFLYQYAELDDTALLETKKDDDIMETENNN